MANVSKKACENAANSPQPCTLLYAGRCARAHNCGVSGVWKRETMRVGLFATCLVDLMRPEIGFSVLRLLEKAGFEVMVPEAQTCCGQPAYNSGERTASRDLAEKFLREFEMFDYVVIPSGSCGGMVLHHYADLLGDDPELNGRYEGLRSRVFELTDFLVNVAKLGEFD